MANIVTFFEYCTSPELRDIFEDDIKELLLGTSKTNREPVFNRLISSILSPLTRDVNLINFRFLLLDILQWRIYQIVSATAVYWFKDPTITHNVIDPDIGRAVAWIRYLATSARIHKAETDYQVQKRPVLF